MVERGHLDAVLHGVPQHPERGRAAQPGGVDRQVSGLFRQEQGGAVGGDPQHHQIGIEKVTCLSHMSAQFFEFMNNFVKFHPLNSENKPAVFILYLYMILFSVIYREMIRFVRRIRGKCWVTFQVLVFLLIYIQISTADGPFQLKLRVGGEITLQTQ